MASLGLPCKFQWVSRLGSVTARHSSSGHQPNFAALDRGCHLYLAGRPSRWALAHISSWLLFSGCIAVDAAYCYRQLAWFMFGKASSLFDVFINFKPVKRMQDTSDIKIIRCFKKGTAREF